MRYAALVLLALSPAALNAATADEPRAKVAPEAMAVLTSAMQSLGGEAVLAKVGALKVDTEGVYTSGAMKSPYTASVLYVRPASLRWDMKSEGFSGSMAIDGADCWSAFMQPPARCRGPMRESMAQWVVQQQVLLVHPLLSRAGAIIDLKAKAEGQTTLSLVIDDGQTFEMVFTEAGGKTFLSALSGPMTTYDGQKGRFEAEYAEPKAFGSLTVPSKTKMTMYDANGKPGETMEETVLSVSVNPEIAKDAFAVPPLTMEIGKPAVEDVPEMTGVVLVHEGAYDTIRETIGKVMKLVMEKGLMPAGPMVTIYLNDPSRVKDPKELRTEVVFPVMLMGPAPEMPKGAEIRTFPGFKAATMNVKGEYGTVERAKIPELFAWMEKNGHVAGGPPRVGHHHQPECTVPEDQLSTIQIPIAR